MKRFISYLVVITMIVSLLGTIPVSATYLPSEGDLIRTATNPAVYYINENGERCLFVNSATFWTWYSGSWADQKVITVTESDLRNLKVGPNMTVRAGTKLIKFDNSSKVYAVTPGSVLSLISSDEVGKSIYGNNWQDRIIVIQSSFENDYSLGDPLNLSSQMPDGSIFRYGYTGDTYIIENGQKRKITNDEFQIDNIKEDFIISVVSEDVVNSIQEIGGKPDLYAENIFRNIDLKSLYVNKPLPLISTVKNIGESSAGVFKIKWYKAIGWTNGVASNWEKLGETSSDGIGGFSNGILDVGGSWEDMRLTWTPSEVTNYLLKYVIDEENKIDESDEKNNEKLQWLSIKRQPVTDEVTHVERAYTYSASASGVKVSHPFSYWTQLTFEEQDYNSDGALNIKTYDNLDRLSAKEVSERFFEGNFSGCNSISMGNNNSIGAYSCVTSNSGDSYFTRHIWASNSNIDKYLYIQYSIFDLGNSNNPANYSTLEQDALFDSVLDTFQFTNS